MHDAKMRELKIGDRVLIPAKVTKIEATPDYCNISLESGYGRRPDGLKENINAINSGVVLRCNPDDTNDLTDPFVLR